MSELPPTGQNNLPLFVHGMWRTGSTYFWHKFRLQQTNRAFLEPLHECLFQMPEQELRDSLPIGITGVLRHPKTDRFYFEEYGFRAEGGVPHFQKHFSYQRYHLNPDASDPQLEAYVLSLLRLAWSNHQRPVLQFNRALMRAGWLARRFKAHTILLLRSPFDTWKSFLSFENLYFPTVISMIIGQNGEDPAVRDIARAHEIPCYLADSMGEEHQCYLAFVKSQLGRLYPAFYELCILANIHAAAYADVVIDVNEVSQNPKVRAFVTAELGRIGADISLEDCAVPNYVVASPEEKLWLSSEDTSARTLLSSITPRPNISAERMAKFSPGFGRYWRAILERYSKDQESPERGLTCS